MYYYDSNEGDDVVFKATSIKELKKMINERGCMRGCLYKGNQLYALLNTETKYFQGQRYYERIYIKAD